MADKNTLDLARIDPPIWRILVADTVYGPYTLGQMRSFVSENRLTLKSQVARGDGGAFMPAEDHAGLSRAFEQKLPQDEEVIPEPANHVVIHRGEDVSRGQVLDVLNGYSVFVEVMDGVFLINTDTRTPLLRDRLVAACAPEDQLLIVNTDDSRLAWQGLGDDLSKHIHMVWKNR